MSINQEHQYKGRRIHIAVSKNGPSYVAAFDIDGIKVAPAMRNVTSTSEAGAAASAKRRAEELIDAQTPPPQPGA